MGSDPYEEPSSHSLTLSPTGYIPSGRCPARSRRIPHSWRGKERTRGLGGRRREGSEKSGRSGPRGSGGKGKSEERKNGAEEEERPAATSTGREEQSVARGQRSVSCGSEPWKPEFMGVLGAEQRSIGDRW